MKKQSGNHPQKIANMFRVIKDARNELRRLQSQYDEEQAAIAAKFNPTIEAVKKRLAENEKELVKTAKTYKKSLFSDSDQVILEGGRLTYVIKKHVVRAKGMLAKLKEIGKSELIKITENPDWSKIDRLPDSELADIGTRREAKEIFEYEVF